MWIKRFNYWFDKVVLYALILVIAALLLFSSWAVVSRMLHSTNLWAEPLSRHLVFLSLFLGATLAVANDQHIRMDIVSRYLELKQSKRLELILTIVLYSLVLVFLTVLLYASWHYYLIESSTPTDAFLFFKLHHMLLLIPGGLSLISFRFLTQLLDKIYGLFFLKALHE